MANLFSSPLSLAQNVVGMAIDTRPVVLYEQQDDYTTPTAAAIAAGASFSELVEANIEEVLWFVNQNKLNELFTGITAGVLSDLNGFNAYGISYFKGEVSITSDIAEHPIEDGTVISDVSIVNPIRVKLAINMPTALYTRIYQQIYDYYTNKKKIMLKTKFGMIKDLIISEMPYTLERDTIDRPEIELTLQQIFIVSPQYVLSDSSENSISEDSTLDAEDSDTSDLGRITAVEA